MKKFICLVLILILSLSLLSTVSIRAVESKETESIKSETEEITETDEPLYGVYTIKYYYNADCREKETETVKFEAGQKITIEDILKNKTVMYGYTYQKCLGLPTVAKEKGGGIHIYFTSGSVVANGVAYYGNFIDKEAAEKSELTYDDFVKQSLIVLMIMATAVVYLIIAVVGMARDKIDSNVKVEDIKTNGLTEEKKKRKKK